MAEKLFLKFTCLKNERLKLSIAIIILFSSLMAVASLGDTPPIANCEPDKLNCQNVNTPVQFNASESYDQNGSILSYEWDFGDDTTGTGVAPNHKYTSYRWNGSAYLPFIVHLNVTNDKGITSITSRQVTIWLAGDANGDGVVNILDASVVGLNWGGSDACADLNNDGSVNILDASIIGLNWMRKAAIILELPPDPATVAPPVDTTVATSIATSTSFLYTGSDPIQTGVAPGTIEARRASVLRGRVLTRDGTNLSGVNITILSHPEFGSTLTRADGMFDMAVNGGGLLTVNYEKTGYLTAQRQVNAPWQDYAWLPDIVMIQADPVVTNIDLSSTEPIQVAQSSIVNDSDGTRQATLLFPQGIQANMTMPDGTTQPLAAMHVRATEYTVGTSGPNAMPAQLPPNSGYTYAVEFSVDEAPGASEIYFSQPLPFYLENFLNFSIGTTIPLGSYNRSLGQWIASDSGIVIKVLSITGGLAEIDVDGSNQSANTSQLAALGITDAERQQLATLYQPNETLWRMPIPHFTQPWDANLGTRCIDNDCEFPNQRSPNKPIVDCQNKQTGSIIGCQNQVLGEEIGITGTPFSLFYQSDRVPGRKAELDIQLSGMNVPTKLIGIVLKVSVAGRNFTYGFPATPNQKFTFIWDGRDAYNRTLQGPQPVIVRVGYSYKMEYIPTDRFGYNGNGLASVACMAEIQANTCGARQNMVLWQEFQSTIGVWDERGQGLGGWSLNVHHIYDPQGKILYLGDGGRRSASAESSNIITTVAGNGVCEQEYINGWYNNCFGGDNGSATQARLNNPYGIAIGPDGSIYIADWGNNRIRRVSSDGNITTVAGSGNVAYGGGYSGDGGPATQAKLSQPRGVAIGPGGSIYIADWGNNRIRRVSSDGIITTVAGNGQYCYPFTALCGDGGPAKQAQLGTPVGIAIGPDGSIYYSMNQANRIRRVSSDGIITTVAGTGIYGGGGDGGSAAQAGLQYPNGVSVGPDGSFYIADTDNNRIRRVGSDGIITTVAGTGFEGYSNDGGSIATQIYDTAHGVLNHPEGVAVGSDGSVYIADSRNHRIRRVSSDGIITTVAGSGNPPYGFGYSGDGGPATQASLRTPFGVAVGPDGSIYIADTINNRINRVAPLLPGFSLSDLFIPSEDGSEIYMFSSNGRHLSTLDALTNSVRYQFAYDIAGRLSSVTDGDGNIVGIERDASGNATAIISPYGQRTDLSIDANGYLTSITDPAGDVHQFGYTADGLLIKMTDPRNNIYRFSYDALGRLVKDEDPAGGFKALERTDIAKGYSVKLSTGLNRNTTYQVESLSTGDQRRVNTFPDGLKTETIIGTNGSRSENYADGTRTTVVEGPDPRFGMLAPVPKSMTIKIPGGLTESITSERTAALINPNNPLSLKTLTETASINGRTFTSTFDAASRIITSQTPMGRKTITALDDKGRMVKSQVPGIVPVNFTYDSRGRLSSVMQGTRNSTFSYDADGNLAGTTDPMLHTAGFEYDLAGRIRRQTLPDGLQIAYDYDANGNVISITPPGRPDHAFNYTPLDLIEEYLPPDVGVPGLTHYSYNIERQLINVTRPDGAAIDIGYDSAGRLSTINYPNAITSMSYDAVTGNLKDITAPDGGKITYAYDGSLLTDTTWSGAISGSVHRTYDNNFRIISESVNGANTVNLQYDLDGLLTQAGSLSLSRDPQNGMLTGSALGNTTDTIGYDSFGAPESYQVDYNGAGIFLVNYTRDDLGRIVQKDETIDGETHTYAYMYDQAGRLTNVSRDGVAVSQYVYDVNGNRLSYTGAGGTISGSYDNQDRLMQYGTTSYTYTANGELLSKTTGSQTTNYLYDVLGNLLNVSMPDGTKIEYLVDGQNRRIGKKVNGILVQGFLYRDGLQPVTELDGAGNVVSRFVYTRANNVPEYMIKGNATYRIVKDHLGSPRFVLNTATGAVAQRMDYDEFGNVTSDTTPGFQPFGFAGGLYDRDTRIDSFGARDYDAQFGRWTVKDPILFAGGDTELYGYVLNDPVNAVDPMGLVDFTMVDEYLYSKGYITENELNDRLAGQAAGTVISITMVALYMSPMLIYGAAPAAPQAEQTVKTMIRCRESDIFYSYITRNIADGKLSNAASAIAERLGKDGDKDFLLKVYERSSIIAAQRDSFADSVYMRLIRNWGWR